MPAIFESPTPGVAPNVSNAVTSNKASPLPLPTTWISMYKEHCTYLPAMLGWFVFSALLSAYNKFVFGNDHKSFPCPLLLTSMHFGCQWLFSHVACMLFPLSLGTARVKQMSWREWLSISVPCGLVTSGDVGLSNLSMVSLSISFYTMIKASTPIFVLLWAYFFGIERITWNLIGVVFVICIGELLAVCGEVKFDWIGFTYCLSAAVLSGARWTLVQFKLQKLNPRIQTTIATMRLLAPSMFISMFILSIIIEQPLRTLKNVVTAAAAAANNNATANDTTSLLLYDDISDAIDLEEINDDYFNITNFTDTSSGDIEAMGLLELELVFMLGLLGGILAICMILCEFYLILHASAVILMIGGVCKELFTISIGVTFFHDELNAINVTGCIIVFCGVLLYKVFFHLKKHESADVTNDSSRLTLARKKKHSSDFDLLLENQESVTGGLNSGNDDGVVRGRQRRGHNAFVSSSSPSSSVELPDRSRSSAKLRSSKEQLDEENDVPDQLDFSDRSIS